ncbi:hypothetical protein IP86_03925 [Rhodopseudomonas sp. AAP120]|uniref:hypothetical protein n=1 Tax=Rhodopseudomonas sp. AAP120 TaxID=1523430 RepID=UPI0006B9DED8|nr:hypothetical protein [Rhodopseudomonas sp. AAP120]KPG01414.1 hypothetical protein IP86_03925 [Rhodopseudomonas sp. AAP120]
MVTGVGATTSYYAYRTSASGSVQTTTSSDASAATEGATQQAASAYRVDISQVKPLPAATPISAIDDPTLRDLLATAWLTMHRAQDVPAGPADNAPENTYARIKIGGKVVATVYNSGVSEMSNAAAGELGDLQDPPNLLGPNLAQWRAENYARVLGGTVEKASTAITQDQWTPRESTDRTYTREQLDAAFEAMVAEGQRATAQSAASYQQPASPQGQQADLSA